jgi:hypothetical protein
MTRFRIRLLITLALFAAATVVAVSVASAAQTWSVDGTPTQTTIGTLKGPGVGTTSGEPDLPTGSPSKMGSKSATPQQPNGEVVSRMPWWSGLGRWIWAAWFPILLR